MPPAPVGRGVRVPRRRLFALLAAALTAVLVLGNASPAHASIWQLSDGFEGSPVYRWSFDGEGDHYGSFSNHPELAHSGNWYGYIDQFSTGWSSVGRSVHLTPAEVHQPSCAVKFWLARVTASPVVAIEVIDPATWTYIALYHVTGPGQSPDWQSFAVGPWRATQTDVFLRFTVGSTAGTLVATKIDDVVVSCSY
ncbi:MAG: hypothetical protein HOU81_27705 [Hamadaea sp.]|uniref:hypothetical protein n=1 Tax=Hamadaea sp. TaxID=2024425 RepID=UPI0017C60C87|nr:hypothetical protein [Hamadaea sp.]NUR74609.1 hypothetical protein [Hamadaea sp.]NUT17625.1 hypothetical protein [Hamadaea sp.]